MGQVLSSIAAFTAAVLIFFGGGVAQPTFEQVYRAISEQESAGSGGYKAVGQPVNGHRAYGKYQVMDFNIPSWTRTYYGKSLTPEQFRNNPAAQEAVARGVLKSYYNKWGARGAAAAWYAGPGNHNLDQSTRPQPGGPSIKGYVDSVISKAYKYPAGGGGGSSGGGGKPSYSEQEVKKMSKGELAEEYGFVDSLLTSNPELKKLFDKAVKGQWTPQKFQAELRDTKWWKTHSESERKFLTLKFGDPKTADQKIDQAYTHVRQLANQMGIVETAENLKRMKAWAYNVVAKGWDDSMLRNDIGKYVYFNEKQQGEGGQAMMDLKKYAYDMGVTMSGSWYADKSRLIIRGMATEQDMKDEINKHAKGLYPEYAKQIDAGQTMADIASPYVQSMQNILEVPAGSLSVQDKTIKSALQNKNKKTGENEAMPLWQFENQLRNDPRWKKTQNAQNSLMQVAHQVLSDFGVAY